jgi:hypothetical protein
MKMFVLIFEDKPARQRSSQGQSTKYCSPGKDIETSNNGKNRLDHGKTVQKNPSKQTANDITKSCKIHLGCSQLKKWQKCSNKFSRTSQGQRGVNLAFRLTFKQQIHSTDSSSKTWQPNDSHALQPWKEFHVYKKQNK